MSNMGTIIAIIIRYKIFKKLRTFSLDTKTNLPYFLLEPNVHKS